MTNQDFTIKEMVRELMDKVDSLALAQNTSTTALVAINQHLAQLNSKVAKHEEKLQEHSNFITKATAIVTLVATSITLAINKLNFL